VGCRGSDPARARNGIAFAGITNSAHVGVLGVHLAPVAEANMVGFAFTNSPAAIPAWGGKKPLFGTDPGRGHFPAKGQAPIVVDLALTTVVRGKIMMAMRKGEKIPEGWALDRNGKPTTDPKGSDRARQPVPDRRREGRDARADVRADLRRAHRLGDRPGGRLVLLRGRQQAAHRPGLPRHRPGALAGMDRYFERVETVVSTMLADPEVRPARLAALRCREIRAR
jgi:(2R)-3-sulfolactate dehydrogenase (NADP+)